MNKADAQKMFDELEAVLSKYAVPDYFLVGIDISGEDHCLANLGHDGAENSNRTRYLHLLGLIQDEAAGMVKTVQSRTHEEGEGL